MKVNRLRGAYRVALWTVFAGSFAVLGLALSPISGRSAQNQERRSTDPPAAPKGKLGQDLFLAIDHRDFRTVESLLKQGADPNSTNGLEFRPIFVASASYQMDVMQALLTAGAKPDARTTYGTPLMFAASSGNLVGAKILLAHGADPTTVRSDGMSILMMASNAGNPALVEELLKAKVAIDIKDDGGETALAIAAHAGHLEVGKLLLAAGARVETIDEEGQTPLMIAAKTGHHEFVKLLLDKGAKPNAADSSGRTALMLAALNGDYPEVAHALLNGGAASNLKDSNGITAARMASAHSYPAIAGVLGVSTVSPRDRTARQAVTLSLKMLERTTKAFEESTTCVSCHHEGLGRIATGEAKGRGFQLDPSIQKAQSARLKGMLTAMTPLHKGALKSPEVMKQVPLMEINEISTTDTWLLAGMAAQNDPPTEGSAAMTMVLARQQSSDGHWGFSLPRVPMQSSAFTFTALSIRCLKVYGPKAEATEIKERIAKAREWLIKAVPVTSEDRASKLLGLKWAEAESEAIQEAVQAVISDQRSDGGWSQMPDLNSDAYATGGAKHSTPYAWVDW